MSGDPAATSGPAPLAGRYELVRLLGQGSFGRTFLARDLEAGGRPVAVKQLRTSGEDAWKRYELFEREAAVLGALRHHGIPAVHGHLRVPGDGGAEEVYLVMEYIEGDSLAQRIDRREHLDSTQVIDLLLGLLAILEYLHTRVPPVLHRDVKPANVIVRPDGAPALVDFGAVRNVFKPADEGGSTVVGTFGYMPFEQYMGQAGPASDLYALGATLLHLVTGRPPADFVGPDGQLRVPEDLPGGPTLRAVLVKLLAHAPGDRYATARAAREALLSAIAAPERSIAVRPASPLVPTGTTRPEPALLRQLAISPTRMLFTSRRPSAPVTAWMLLAAVLTGLLTLGFLPIYSHVIYRQRRERLRRFLAEGTPVEARLLRTESRDEWNWVETTYEYRADGVLRRGVDQVFPAVARGWQPGDTVRVLYIAGVEYDSMVIETC